MLSPGREDVSLWLPDLAVGLVLAGAALLGRHGQRVLLGLGAVAWFLGTVTPAASFLHVGVLVHADGLLADPALGAAVSSATRLAGSHAALRTEVDTRLAELADSQRRLVQAADEERDRLESRLREGAEARLAALGEILDRAGSVSPAAAARVAAARGELVHASGDLRALARGLRPRELDAGLPSALTEPARRTPLPVDVVAPAGRYPDGGHRGPSGLGAGIRPGGGRRPSPTAGRCGPPSGRRPPDRGRRCR